jgi:hypothetical protein
LNAGKHRENLMREGLFWQAAVDDRMDKPRRPSILQAKERWKSGEGTVGDIFQQLATSSEAVKFDLAY